MLKELQSLYQEFPKQDVNLLYFEQTSVKQLDRQTRTFKSRADVFNDICKQLEESAKNDDLDTFLTAKNEYLKLYAQFAEVPCGLFTRMQKQIELEAQNKRSSEIRSLRKDIGRLEKMFSEHAAIIKNVENTLKAKKELLKKIEAEDNHNGK